MFDMLDLICIAFIFFYNRLLKYFSGYFRGIFRVIKGYFRSSNHASVGRGWEFEF